MMNRNTARGTVNMFEVVKATPQSFSRARILTMENREQDGRNPPPNTRRSPSGLVFNNCNFSYGAIQINIIGGHLNMNLPREGPEVPRARAPTSVVANPADVHADDYMGGDAMVDLDDIAELDGGERNNEMDVARDDERDDDNSPQPGLIAPPPSVQSSAVSVSPSLSISSGSTLPSTSSTSGYISGQQNNARNQ